MLNIVSNILYRLNSNLFANKYRNISSKIYMYRQALNTHNYIVVFNNSKIIYNLSNFLVKQLYNSFSNTNLYSIECFNSIFFKNIWKLVNAVVVN